MSFAENLRRYREDQGFTQKEVAEKIGASRSTYSNYETGNREPDVRTIKAISEVLGVPSDVLLGTSFVSILSTYTKEEKQMISRFRLLDTHGQKVVAHVLNDEYDRMTNVESIEQKGWISYINLYDLAVSAGTGEPLGNTYYATKISVPAEKVPEGAHCCVRVNGDSMEPAYKDGDIVFVHRQDEPVREGEIGIFSLNSDGYMKKLGPKRLESLNPKYEPIEIHNYDELRCFGKVLGKLD